MTKDDIIRMLHEVGYPDYAKESDQRVIAFASLVAASEREACAKLCDKAAKDWGLNAWDDDADKKYGHKESACEECAEAIRSRSQP